jgi:hypothetical protein
MDMSEYGVAETNLLQHNAVARRHWQTISAIKEFVFRGCWDAAHEAFEELDHEEQKILYRAPSNGGFFTTQERRIIKGVDQAENWAYGVGRVSGEAEFEL